MAKPSLARHEPKTGTHGAGILINPRLPLHLPACNFQLAGGLRTAPRLPVAPRPGQFPRARGCSSGLQPYSGLITQGRGGIGWTPEENLVVGWMREKEGWGAGRDTWQQPSLPSTPLSWRPRAVVGENNVNSEPRASGKVLRMRQVQGKEGISLRSMDAAGEQHPCNTAQTGTGNTTLSSHGLLGPDVAPS